MHKVTIKIAKRGAATADGSSRAGHMWYSLTDDQGDSHSYGFHPKKAGSAWGPGLVNAHGLDDVYYKDVAFSIPVEITDKQYQAMQDFGTSPEKHGFADYHLVTNSCVDFTWKALEIAGLNPEGFEGNTFPADNIKALKEMFPAKDKYWVTLALMKLKELFSSTGSQEIDLIDSTVIAIKDYLQAMFKNPENNPNEQTFDHKVPESAVSDYKSEQLPSSGEMGSIFTMNGYPVSLNTPSGIWRMCDRDRSTLRACEPYNPSLDSSRPVWRYAPYESPPRVNEPDPVAINVQPTKPSITTLDSPKPHTPIHPQDTQHGFKTATGEKAEKEPPQVELPSPGTEKLIATEGHEPSPTKVIRGGASSGSQPLGQQLPPSSTLQKQTMTEGKKSPQVVQTAVKQPTNTLNNPPASPKNTIEIKKNIERHDSRPQPEFKKTKSIQLQQKHQLQSGNSIYVRGTQLWLEDRLLACPSYTRKSQIAASIESNNHPLESIQKTCESQQDLIRQLTKIHGDGSNIENSGHLPYYQYAFSDVITLLTDIRNTYLDYTDCPMKDIELPYDSRRRNVGRIFIADPYSLEDFQKSFEEDIRVITRISNSKNDQYWGTLDNPMMPTLLILPIFAEDHWCCLRIEMRYEEDEVDILWDDPYGEAHFTVQLKQKILSRLRPGFDMLFQQQTESTRSIFMDENVKQIIQQRQDVNPYDGGVIILSNIRDYTSSIKNSQFAAATANFTTGCIDDLYYAECIDQLRAKDHAIYLQIIAKRNDTSSTQANTRAQSNTATSRSSAEASLPPISITGHKETLPAVSKQNTVDKLEVKTIPILISSQSIYQPTQPNILQKDHASHRSLQLWNNSILISIYDNRKNNTHGIKFLDLRSNICIKILTSTTTVFQLLPNNRLACYNYDNSIQIFDLISYSQIKEFMKGFLGFVPALSVHIDGQLIIGGQQGEINFFNPDSGLCTQTLTDNSLDQFMQVLPVNQNRLLSLSFKSKIHAVEVKLWEIYAAEVKLWDLKSKTCTQTYPSSSSYITLLPGGRFAMVDSNENHDYSVSYINIREVETGRSVQKFSFTCPIAILSYHTFNNLIVICKDNIIHVVSLRTSSLLRTLRAAKEIHTVSALLSLPDGRLFTGTPDGIIESWNATEVNPNISSVKENKTGISKTATSTDLNANQHKLIAKLGEIESQIEQLTSNLEEINRLNDILEDQTKIPTIPPDSKSKEDNTKIPKSKFLQGHTALLKSLQVLDDNILVSSSFDNTIKLWNLQENSLIKTLGDGVLKNHGPVLLLSDNRLASASDTKINIWDLQTYRITKSINVENTTLTTVADSITALAEHPDGRLIIGTLNSRIDLWDLNSLTCTQSLIGHLNRKRINLLLPLPLERLISASSDKAIKLWDLRNGNCIRTYPYFATSIISLPGNKFAIGSVDGSVSDFISSPGSIKIIDIESAECIQNFPGHTKMISSLLFDPSNKLISASPDNTIRFWDLNSNTLIRTIHDHSTTTAIYKIMSLLWNPHGGLISSNSDGTIQLWDSTILPSVFSQRISEYKQLSLSVNLFSRIIRNLKINFEEVRQYFRKLKIFSKHQPLGDIEMLLNQWMNYTNQTILLEPPLRIKDIGAVKKLLIQSDAQIKDIYRFIIHEDPSHELFKKIYAEQHEFIVALFMEHSDSKHVGDTAGSLDGSSSSPYNIKDVLYLTTHIRLSNLDYSNCSMPSTEGPFDSLHHNMERIFLSNPCQRENIKSSFIKDIQIMSKHWYQKGRPLMPILLIIPILSNSQWQCIRLEIDYEDNSISVLWDDPRGGQYFSKDVRRSILKDLNEGIDLLFTTQHGAPQRVMIQDTVKQLVQQGNDYPEWVSGVIIVSNLREYIRNTTNIEFTSKNADFTIGSVKEKNHLSSIKKRHEMDRKIYHMQIELENKAQKEAQEQHDLLFRSERSTHLKMYKTLQAMANNIMVEFKRHAVELRGLVESMEGASNLHEKITLKDFAKLDNQLKQYRDIINVSFVELESYLRALPEQASPLHYVYTRLQKCVRLINLIHNKFGIVTQDDTGELHLPEEQHEELIQAIDVSKKTLVKLINFIPTLYSLTILEFEHLLKYVIPQFLDLNIEELIENIITNNPTLRQLDLQHIDFASNYIVNISSALKKNHFISSIILKGEQIDCFAPFLLLALEDNDSLRALYCTENLTFTHRNTTITHSISKDQHHSDYYRLLSIIIRNIQNQVTRHSELKEVCFYERIYKERTNLGEFDSHNFKINEEATQQLIDKFRTNSGLLSVDDDGNTFLHLAVINECPILVKFFLEEFSRLKVNIGYLVNKAGKSPFNIAIENSNHQIIQLFTNSILDNETLELCESQINTESNYVYSAASDDFYCDDEAGCDNLPKFSTGRKTFSLEPDISQTSSASTMTTPISFLFDIVSDTSDAFKILWSYFTQQGSVDIHGSNALLDSTQTDILSSVEQADQKHSSSSAKLDNHLCEQVSIDGVSALMCSGESYTTYVFATTPVTDTVTALEELTPITSDPLSSDNYTNCQPIEFYGKPSVTCEGAKTSMVYTPHHVTHPIDSLNAQLMLARIGVHLVSKMFSWFWGSSSETQENEELKMGHTVNSEEVTSCVASAEDVLGRIEAKLDNATPMIKKSLQTWVPDVILSMRDNIERLEKQKIVYERDIEKIELDIAYLEEEFNDEWMAASTQHQQMPLGSLNFFKSANKPVPLNKLREPVDVPCLGNISIAEERPYICGGTNSLIEVATSAPNPFCTNI